MIVATTGIISVEALEKINNYFTDFSYESGGILLGQQEEILDFVPIKNLSKNKKSYIPSFHEINKVLKKSKLFFLGIIHSHTVGTSGSGCYKPSNEDIEFYKNLLEANLELDKIYCPIITIRNNKKEISWYEYQK